MKKLIYFKPGRFISFFFILISGCLNINNSTNSKIKPGDILFQDINDSPLYDAIERVSAGYNESKLAHIGIALEDSTGKLFVIEAIEKGVVATPIDTFLNRSLNEQKLPKVIVGRLDENFTPNIKAIEKEAKAFLGKPFDSEFSIMNDKYYGAELVYEIFHRANNGNPIFELDGLNFIDLETKEVVLAWQIHFRKLNMNLPQGVPGITPGSISLSRKIHITYIFGKPKGWKERP